MAKVYTCVKDPETNEHWKSIKILGLEKSTIVLHNKIDLVNKDKALEQLQAANIVLNTWLSGVDPILRIQVEWLAKNPPSSGGFGFMPSSPVVTPTEDPGVADQTKSLEGIASKLSVLDTPAMVLSDTVSAEQNDSIKLLVTAAQFTMQKMQDLSARLKYVPKYVQVQAGKFIETNGWLTQSFKSTQINGQDAFEQFVTIMSCKADLMPTVAEMNFYAFPLDEANALVVAKLLPQFTGLTKFTYRNSLSLTAFQAILSGLKEVPTLQSFSIQGTQADPVNYSEQPITFTSDHVKALAEVLPHFPSLTTLNLYNTQLGSGGLVSLTSALLTATTLTNLQLSKINIDETAAPNIVQLIQKPALSDLDLTGNTLGDKGIIALVDALEPSGKKSSLVRLSLRENQLTAASSGLIAGMFLAKAKPRDSFANLTAVGLSGNPIQYFDDVYPALNEGQTGIKFF